MLVALQAISRHVCEMYSLPCSRSFPEQLFSLPCMAVFAVLYFVLGRSELHFAKIDDAVFSVNQKINLCPIVFRSPRNMPGTVIGHDSGDAKRNFDLPDMLKAEPLERKALPDSAELRIGRCAPETAVPSLVLAGEGEMKQREIVYKLVESALGNFGQIIPL